MRLLDAMVHISSLCLFTDDFSTKSLSLSNICSGSKYLKILAVFLNRYPATGPYMGKTSLINGKVVTNRWERDISRGAQSGVRLFKIVGVHSILPHQFLRSFFS